jgi:hypothetical protein
MTPKKLTVLSNNGTAGGDGELKTVLSAAFHWRADPRVPPERGCHSLDRHVSYAVTAWLDSGASDEEVQ